MIALLGVAIIVAALLFGVGYEGQHQVKVGVVALVLIVAGFVVLIGGLVVQDRAWNRSCRDAGGHPVSVGDDHLCVSSDGRLLRQ